MHLKPDLSGVDDLTVNLTQRVCIGDVPTRAAAMYRDRVAIIDGDTETTYCQLEERSNALARSLRAEGFERGDAIGLLMMNRWEFVVSFFACAKIGVVVLPLNLMLSARDIAYQLSDSGARAVVAEEAMLPLLGAALRAEHAVRTVYVVGNAPQQVGDVPAKGWTDQLAKDTSRVEVLVEDRDILCCLYTSGTTSRPKGVLTSHVAVQIAALTSAVTIGSRPGTEPGTQVIVLPLFHVTALIALLMPALVVGEAVVLHRGFDPVAIAQEFTHRSITQIALLPMMWGAVMALPSLADADTDTRSLRLGFYAMAPMPADLLTRIRSTFSNASILLGSGQTETTPLSQMQWDGLQGVKDNSWGNAVNTTHVAIMGSDGALLGAGEEGEIVYRTPQLMAGYLNNARANTEAFAGGWFHGGDIGYLDNEGVVWFTDRAKDMIKTGGENVSSIEVERVVLAHPAVLECAVVATPDPHWGEAVTAYIVVTDQDALDLDEMHAFCRERLAGFKVPKTFVPIEALPKTGTGKIRKTDIRRSHP